MSPAIRLTSCSLALGLLLAAGAAHAQTRPGPISQEELARLLDQALPPVIGSDNGELVEKLLRAEMGKPLRETFQLGRAVQAIYGRVPPTFSPDCPRRQTPVAEPDQGECVTSAGQEIGQGAYTRFSFSKNLGVGNIALLRRPALRDLAPEDLQPVKLSDEDAYEQAQAFLANVLGLDLAETSKPPDGANILPVSTLNIGLADERTQLPPIPIEKVVHLKRGLAVEGIRDPASGRELPYVPAPGMATVMLNDQGVVGALVEDWQELRRDPKMDPRRAKSRAQLVKEISEDLAAEEIVDLARLTSLLVISSDWRGTIGLLLPAVQVFVSPVPADLDEQQQNELEGRGTAGFVREYALVDRAPEELEER